MTVETGASPSGGAPDAELSAWVPALAEGVTLLGGMRGSGYREPPALVRRADGQTLQLTPLLYEVLAAVDGSRSPAEIAALAGEQAERTLTASNVVTLLRSQLLPLGVLRLPDGREPEVKRSDPLLRMRFRVAVTDPERTRRVTAPFAALFTPFLAVPVLLGFAWIFWWVLFDKGLASATSQAFDNPGLLLLVFAITLLSAGFHEFGHAAASTRGGAAPGTMGAGLYLVWPAFYTDVTDSYRLGRWGRLRTDLGGLYFNAIVAVLTVGVWFVTRYDALLLVVATQILMMVRQLAPIVRFDGYHILADATGVPDLFSRIGPTLRGMLPWRWKDPENRVLKPWARIVITAWVLVVVPLLLLSVVLLVLAFPRLLGTAFASLGEQGAALSAAWTDGDGGGVAVRLLAMLAIVLPVAGLTYLLVRLVRQTVARTWRSTREKPVRRGIATATALAVVAALVWAWWPSPDAYRPVQPYEDGTLVAAVNAVAPGADRGTASAGATGDTVVVWPDGVELPTRDDPTLALLLLPADGVPGAVEGAEDSDDGGPASDPAAGGGGAADGGAPAPPWVFPFDRPEAPGEGDNQALAVATTDGSVAYDVAFALVWTEDDTVDTRNEAYAFASCTGCAAVAIGFQVVLSMGQADVVVPENIAAAVNVDCVDCVAFALARQLVITIDGPLSAETLAAIDVLWAELTQLAQGITGLSLSDIEARLGDIADRISAAVLADPAAVPLDPDAPLPTPTPTATPTPAATDPGSDDGADNDTGTGTGDPGTDAGGDSVEQPAAPEEPVGEQPEEPVATTAPTPSETPAPATEESTAPEATPAP